MGSARETRMCWFPRGTAPGSTHPGENELGSARETRRWWVPRGTAPGLTHPGEIAMHAHRASGLYAHITWHTWRRQRFIRRQDVALVTGTVLHAAERCNVRVHSQAVLSDHVHVVVSYGPSVALTPFIRHAKSESARRINLQRTLPDFRWARGYYVGSLSRTHVSSARIYVGSQHRRHPELVPT